MSPEDAFFLPDGDGFIASELTRGPWSRDHQHGGPPTALMARAIDRRAAEAGDFQVTRVTIELLRPIPIGRCAVATEVVRAGRKAQLLAARLEVDGREVARATALALRAARLDLPPTAAAAAKAPPPEQSEAFHFPFFREPAGYHTAVEIRVARGTFGRGALAAWMRMRCPLIAGEEPSPLERVLVVADSTNGLSAALDTDRYTFVNPELTVHLHRRPEGEWILLDAVTTVDPGGVGLAESALHDRRGPIGRAAQSLLIEERRG